MNARLKLCLFVLLFSFSHVLLAQTFAIKGGLNLAKIQYKDDFESLTDDFSLKAGLLAGATVELTLSERIGFNMGLLYSNKGAFLEYEEPGYYEETKLNINYLELPFHLKVYQPINNFKVYGLFGPYLGLAFNGNVDSRSDYMGDIEEYKESIEIGNSEDDDIKPFDFGLNVGAGIEIRKIFLEFNYGLGLANLATYNEDEMKIRNRVITICLGYRIN